MRSRNIQYFTMLIGSLLALAIVVAQLHPLHVNAEIGKDVKKTETRDTNHAEDATVISLPSFSLPPPLHVANGLTTHCLFEIFLENDRPEVSESETPSIPLKLLLTLFRVIISPNAP